MPKAIESALNQTYTNLEIVIVDDFSTDRSWEILTAFAQKYPQIRIEQNKSNLGVGYTKKKLLDEAKGEILFILDSDDAIAKQAVSKSVEIHLKNPEVGLVYTDQFMCNVALQPLKQESISRKIPKHESHLSFHGIGHLVSIKKSAYNKIPGLNPNLKVAVDQDLYYQMEEVAPIQFLNEKLYFYRQNMASISLNQNKHRAWNQKIELIEQAIERRMKAGSALKLPSSRMLYLSKWYSRHKLGPGNILIATRIATQEFNFKVLAYIAEYHLRRSIFRYL